MTPEEAQKKAKELGHCLCNLKLPCPCPAWNIKKICVCSYNHSKEENNDRE